MEHYVPSEMAYANDDEQVLWKMSMQGWNGIVHIYVMTFSKWICYDGKLGYVG